MSNLIETWMFHITDLSQSMDLLFLLACQNNTETGSQFFLKALNPHGSPSNDCCWP